MMLNSIGSYKRLLLALVCSSMSYSTLAKVYSWRDADGAMHYSQFPRQIVEKNAAQSRASRKQANMNDVVKDLSLTKSSNLLDGLDDIVANANAERQVEKVLTRRDPQLVLIEQQLARQQAEQRTHAIAKQEALEKQKALVVASNTVEVNRIKAKQTLPKNSFMAGIHKRAYGNAVTKTNDLVQPIASTQLVSVSTQDLNTAEDVAVKQPRKVTNKFLAGIKKKLNRKDEARVIDENVLLASQNKSLLDSKLARESKLKATPEQVQNKFLAEINKKLFRARLGAGIIPESELVKSESVSRAKGRGTTTAKNKELMQSADQIKAIENEISSSSKSNKVKSPSAKQVNSALMLSRLSYNHNARLPLSGAGTNQLDRQGIEVSSQFVSEVNRSAE